MHFTLQGINVIVYNFHSRWLDSSSPEDGILELIVYLMIQGLPA